MSLEQVERRIAGTWQSQSKGRCNSKAGQQQVPLQASSPRPSPEGSWHRQSSALAGQCQGESEDLFPEKKLSFTTPETLLCADSSAVKPPPGFPLCCALLCALQELFAISNACAGWQWQGGGEQGGGNPRWLSLVLAVVCPCFPGKGITSAVSEETTGAHKLVLCSPGP